MREILNFIQGEFRPAVSGETLEVFEPATGQVYAQLAASSEADVQLAASAASEAFAQWSASPAEERAGHLYRIADLLEAQLDSFAAAESKDTGKPISLARTVDIPRAVANFRFFAAAATQFPSESHAMGNHAVNYTLRKPLGVVGCISPWNLPLYLFSWKLAPAIASGNTVIGKPSEITPATAAMLGTICQEAGLPNGVLNIIQGRGADAGAALCRHADIKAISFTGSTTTGKAIAKLAAPSFTKVSLEMGGKNPTLVFADCDLERTAEEITRSAFSNQGQICLCGSRVLVERSIYPQLRDLLVDKASQLQAADPSLPDTRHGALVSKQHLEKVASYLDLAREEGGRVLGDGVVQVDGRCQGGWFMNPVWVEGLPNDCRTNQEEIFGPVASLQPFDSEQEALALANQSAYGLACSIWSKDISRCHRLANELECGIIWINCWMQRDLRTPFGGMKSSGVGREGGFEAMRFFTEPKNVCVEYGTH